MILRSGRTPSRNVPFPVVVPHWLRREIHASPTGFEGKSTRPPLASKGNPRHGGARSSDADMVGRSQRPCPSLTWSAGRARRWLSPSPTAGKRSDRRTTSWRRTLPARLSSMSWARLCRRQQRQRAAAAAANVQHSCTLVAAVFAYLWAGALARVQRQRSHADASMLVSQSQQARKRQKRAEAAEARRVGEQLMFVDRLPLSPVKNSAL